MEQKWAVTGKLASKYRGSTSRKARSRILDEVQELAGYNRHYAAWLLSNYGKRRVVTNDQGQPVQLVVGRKNKRRANGKISQATKRIPAEMFEEERGHLRPIRNSIFRKDSLQGREERQADDKSLISVCGSQYSVPTKYKNKEVEIYKTEKSLFIFDIHTGGQIYCHDVSLIPEQKVIARGHFRQRDKSARELKQEILSQFSFPSWKRFAEHNFKAFPRYVRDQCV